MLLIKYEVLVLFLIIYKKYSCKFEVQTPVTKLLKLLVGYYY
eukprot:SAG31_NODE_349_length_17243_cov_7.408248_12_plen_42_part_00